MGVFTKYITLDTEPDGIYNITEKVKDVVNESGLNSGIVLIFIPGSTGAITTMEYESGAIQDFKDALSRIAPENIYYKHHEKWHDNNGRSHVKSALLKPDLMVPFKDKNLILGIWQQIVFVELDTKSRHRNIVIQIIGE